MTGFEDRRAAYEALFAHDETLRFQATVRRNRLLALWAGEKMGFSEEDARAYAEALVRADIQEKGEEDVFRRVRKDFDAAHVQQSDHQIRRTMVSLMEQAIASVKQGRKERE